jgi:hypothetical protein
MIEVMISTKTKELKWYRRFNWIVGILVVQIILVYAASIQRSCKDTSV